MIIWLKRTFSSIACTRFFERFYTVGDYLCIALIHYKSYNIFKYFANKMPKEGI